nr:MAG TPA: hypothetical protein [Caudoviricetes sp.]
MMDKNIIFKKEDGRYKLFFIEAKKELDMGVSFITDHNIEDYPILVIESIDGRVSHYKPCKNVVVKLLNPPHLTSRIEISKDANLDFNSDFVLGIENSLVISQNKKTSIFYKPNDEGENLLVFRDLAISGNDNFYLYLTDSNTDRSLDDLLLDSMKKQAQKISCNKNISLSIRRDIRGIDFKNNSGSDNKKRVDIIADSILASINNVTIKVSGATPTINLGADAVALEGTTFEVGGILDITNNGKDTLGGSKLAIANGTIAQTIGDIAHIKSSHLIVDCDYLNIHSNVKLNISGNSEIICQGGRVDFEGGKGTWYLSDSKIIAPQATELTVNELTMQDDALLEITQTKDGKCNIKRAWLYSSQMRDVKGGTIDAFLNNDSKVDGITFGDNSSFVFGDSYFSADDGKYEAKNITLKDNSSLSVKNSKPDDAYMKIEDVIVSDECKIDGNIAANIKNSVLNKASISFTEKQGNIDIVNTIFEGENSIEGISSIVDSSIENSTIVGNNDKIEAFMMRNIKNFSKALEEKKLAENKNQNNKITTKWEPL